MRDLSKENPEISALLKEIFPNVKTRDLSLAAIAESDKSDDDFEDIPNDNLREVEKSTRVVDKPEPNSYLSLEYLKIINEEVDYVYNEERRRGWTAQQIKRKAYELAGLLRQRMITKGGLSSNGSVISEGTVIAEVLWYLWDRER